MLQEATVYLFLKKKKDGAETKRHETKESQTGSQIFFGGGRGGREGQEAA